MVHVRKMLLGVALAGAVAPAAAWAQEPPPVDGGVGVGGSVPSYLELILGRPSSSFSTFAKARTYTTSFTATVTATDQDAGAVLTFSIIGGPDAAKFTISPTTGVLTFIGTRPDEIICRDGRPPRRRQ